MAKYDTIQNMKGYKKRTIALCLASALTVVGAFGAENYSNTLMALRINVGSGGSVNMTTFTKKPLNNGIKQVKIDSNTFVITLPDTDSLAEEPDIDNYDNIENITISTYPYTTESDGCTKIVVKTSGEPRLSANNALFIPENIKSKLKQEPTQNYALRRYESEDSSDEEEESKTEATAEKTAATQNDNNITNAFTPPDYTKTNSSGGSFEYMAIVICVSVILLLLFIIYLFSKDKMASVIGEQEDLDVNGKSGNKKQSKTKKLRSTINKLDKTYSYKTSADINYGTSYSFQSDEQQQDNPPNNTEEEPMNIVDLDLLYQEVQKENNNDNDGNDDLAALLDAFATEEKPEVQAEEEEPFDENLYNSVINNKTLNFTDSDLKKINLLMQTELSEETLSKLKEYLQTPRKKHLTKQQILEEIISTYSIKQNIDFTPEDVDAIQKLMNVELGPDFAKDFTTNPVRTKIVEKEIKENTGKSTHKKSDIVTLKVKDMLPNLSEELKKYGGKAIKSEAKPDVIYYSEGYEYEKLHVSNELSNIANNMGKPGVNSHKPSYQAPIVETGYEVSTLSIKDELPDMADVWANPQKYQDKKPEKPAVNEEALLKSISNVTFKPFYEDVENELNQFDNFEIIDRNKIETEEIKNYYYREKPDIPKKPLSTRNDDNAKKLLKLIEEQQTERTRKKLSKEENEIFKKEFSANSEKKETQKTEPEKTQTLSTHSFDGRKYTTLKAIKINPDCVCRLLEIDGKYIVTGELNNKEYMLKQFENLLNPSMQIRLHDKEDKTKYLVKIGTNKFIISITENNMEFIMDLC